MYLLLNSLKSSESEEHNNQGFEVAREVERLGEMIAERLRETSVTLENPALGK